MYTQTQHPQKNNNGNPHKALAAHSRAAGSIIGINLQNVWHIRCVILHTYYIYTCIYIKFLFIRDCNFLFIILSHEETIL